MNTRAIPTPRAARANDIAHPAMLALRARILGTRVRRKTRDLAYAMLLFVTRNETAAKLQKICHIV